MRAADGGGGRFDVVVAADGVRSRAAGRAPRPAPPRFTGHVAWRGLVPAERAPAELARPAARVTMGPGRHLVTYPLRGGALVNFVAIEERAAWAEEGWSAHDDPANLRRAFAGWGGAAGALLDAVEDCWLWGLFDHAPLPALGQRAAGAARRRLPSDAAVPGAGGDDGARGRLGARRRASISPPDPRSGLVAYEAARLPRATRVQRAAARAGRIYHLRPGPARAGAGGARRSPRLWRRRCSPARFDWLFGHDVTATG